MPSPPPLPIAMILSLPGFAKARVEPHDEEIRGEARISAALAAARRTSDDGMPTRAPEAQVDGAAELAFEEQPRIPCRILGGGPLLARHAPQRTRHANSFHLGEVMYARPSLLLFAARTDPPGGASSTSA